MLVEPCNSAVLSLLGWSRRDIVGSSIGFLLPRPLGVSVLHYMEDLLERGMDVSAFPYCLLS